MPLADARLSIEYRPYTMRTGKKPEGVAIMPPMPVDVYVNMKDDDLKAIYAYLKTIKPIRNAVRAGLTPAKK